MKAALVGYGDWGKILEKYIEQSPFFQLEYIYSRSVKHKKGIKNLEVILNSDIEVAFLALPPRLLVQFTEKFVSAKKHVFCEKPLSTNPKEVSELFKLAKLNHVVLYVNYIYLQSPSVNYIKNQIHLIGNPIKSFFNIKQFGKFYTNQNAFEVLGCHLLAVYFYFFNYTEESNIKINYTSLNENLSQILHINYNEHQSVFHSDLISANKERSIQIIGGHGMFYFCPLTKRTVSFYERDSDNNFTLKDFRSFDENNNIANALISFKETINSKDISQSQYISEKVALILSKTL